MTGKNFTRNYCNDRILDRLLQNARIVTKTVSICQFVDLKQFGLYHVILKLLLTRLLDKKVRVARITPILWYPELNFPEHFQPTRFYEENVLRLVFLAQNKCIC